MTYEEWKQEYEQYLLDIMQKHEIDIINAIRNANRRLTIEMQGSKIVMIDESTKETAILDNKEQAVTNFVSWIYAGHLSGTNTHSTSINRGTLPREAQ